MTPELLQKWELRRCVCSVCACGRAGLLDEVTSAAPDIEVVSSPRAKIIASRLAVVVGVLLLVGVLVAVWLLVDVTPTTSWAMLCVPTSSGPLDPPPRFAYFSNSSLPPCNDTVTVPRLPPTTWSAYI